MNSVKTLGLCSLFLIQLGLQPAFAQSGSSSPTPLIAWSASILKDIQSSNWSDATCVSYLTDLSKKIDDLGRSKTLSSEGLSAQADPLTSTLWSTRLALHERLPNSSDACAREIRNTFRKFRFLEDFLSEISHSAPTLSPDGMDFQSQPVPFIDRSNFYLVQTPDGHDLALQEGDLMIARGVSFLSAMIARLGDVDSQFSHVILVARNPETNLLETIESYVGEGVGEHEMHWALKNENSRLLVLRAKNQELAKRAARSMWQNVHDRGSANKIRYDYQLNFNEHSTMSCAEVAQVAFLNASESEFKLPERSSNLSRGLDLLRSLGITPGSTFTPGDLEYDSRFEMVGEYRDLRLTRDSRLKDAILSKMLEWMDQEHYTLRPDFMVRMARGPVWTLRHTFLWPVVRKILGVADFSSEVPRSMVGTVKLINEFGDGVLKELQKRDDANLASTGLRMTYAELYDALEQIKSEDESVFADKHTRKKSILIKYLRDQ